MKLKTLIAAAFFVAMLGAGAFAQQSPDDLGAQDSVLLRMHPPVAGADDSTFVVDVLFFNDSNTVFTAGLGFSWDSPKITLDSARPTLEGWQAFDQQIFLYKRNLDSSNARQLCQVTMFKQYYAGLEPHDTAFHVASFFFSVDDWTVNDTICLDSAWYSGATRGDFVDSDFHTYKAAWPGTYCVGDPNAPTPKVLEVDPTELTFAADLGGAVPATQYVSVTEQSDQSVGYTATTEQSWIGLGTPSGTTPGSFTVSCNTGAFTEPGEYNGTVTVTGPEAENSIDIPVTFTITQTNQPPEWVPTDDQTAYEDQQLQFTVEASDPDGDDIGLTVGTVPAGAIFNDNEDGTGTFTWEPDYTQAGEYTVVFTAADAEYSVDDTVVITVINVNQPPSLTEVPDQQVVEEQELTFTVTGDDPDGQLLTFSLVDAPVTAVLDDNGDNTADFSWTPADGDADNYDFYIIGSDGDLADTIEVFVEVLPNAAYAQLQLIHNAADPGAVVVDVWVNGVVFEEDFAFRTATPFVQVPAGEDLTVGVSAPDAVEPLVTFAPLNLTEGEAYVAIANGVIDDTQFEANPDGRAIALDVFAITGAQTTGTDAGNIDFAALHGATDAPTVDVIARGVATLVDNAAYGDIVAYQSVPAAAYVLDVTPGDDTTTIVASFDADLSGVGGRAAVVFASGFLTPENDQDGPAFGLFAALDDGTVVAFPLIVPPKTLVVAPESLDFTISEGDEVMPSELLAISEAGDEAIAFTVWHDTDAVWIDLSDTAGTTPDEVTIGLAAGELPAGTYNANVYVASEEADNSPVIVPVTLAVTACPVLQPATAEYDVTIIEGETATVLDTLSLTSDSDIEIDFEADGDDYFTFTPGTGTTPAEVEVAYSHEYATAGVYADTAYITSVYVEGNTCASSVMVVVNTIVNRPPSADTLIAVNTPAVPGMHVSLPLTFANSCSLSELGIVLEWASEYILLDSVSFVGSDVEYFDNKMVTIDNENDYVTIHTSVGAQSLLPASMGGQQDWATLWFTLQCEIADGSYPLALGDGLFEGYNVFFYRDCGEGSELEVPEYIPGNLVVGEASNYVCGYVVDPDMNEIEGATVELWDDFPAMGPDKTTLSTGIGSFAFDSIMSVPFDVYAYKEGYYPGLVENINFGDKGIMIILQPLEELVPTSQQVDYYCGDNTYFGAPVPVGAVVEAYTPAGLLVGRQIVIEPGSYRFMPVYRANDEFSDDGAVAGENISFRINNYAAVATGNTIYPAVYDSVQVCLEVRGVVDKECELVEGWNLISWNVDTDSDDILDVLGPIMDNIDVILGFEGGGLTYAPDLPEFSTLWEVDHLSGYWVYISEGAGSQTLTVTGLPVPVTTPIPVYTGWNLVSYLPEDTYSVEMALSSIMDNLFAVYGYDTDLGMEIYKPSGGEFNLLESMMSCNGYWIKSNADDMLVYPEAVVVPAAKSMPVANLAPRTMREPGVVTSNAWVNLYAGDLTVDGQRVRSGAVVTAHAVDGDALVGRFAMTVDGRFGFMPVYAGADSDAALTAGEQFYLRVNGIQTQEKLTWTGNGDRIEVAALTTGNGVTLPGTYSLSQNYPNPFNPSTNISFTMPAAGTAKIEVFNILGRLIATPFDGTAQAGENTVVWDGTDHNGQTVASGVYFYRLSADRYNETRKMMLLK